nr:MAG TPA: hypothetical protein [Caudoviricetes sp.]DAY02497.1 MAG TPA: hypothetical protein [Caudoviricetes sp.]
MDFFQSTADQLHTNETRSRNGANYPNLGRVLDVLHRIGETLPFPLYSEEIRSSPHS